MDNPDTAAILPGMEPESDILIIGGGLNGPALALALAQGGLTVTVIDTLAEAARADDGFDGRAYALALASQRLLQAIGVWDGIATLAQPILGIRQQDHLADDDDRRAQYCLA